MKTVDTRGEKVCLRPEAVALLKTQQRTGKISGPQARRSRILELLAGGLRQCDVARQTGAEIVTVGRVRRPFLHESLEAAVFDYVSTEAPRLLAASGEGTLGGPCLYRAAARQGALDDQMLASEVVRRGILKGAGRETVRLVLKHHGIKPWREKMWCMPRMDDEYRELMDDLFDLYERPLNPEQPGVCLDEKLIVLHGDTRPSHRKRNGELRRH